jgi:WD40 repeat protein
MPHPLPSSPFSPFPPTPIPPIAQHNKPIKAVYAYNESIIVTGGWDGLVRYWDVRAPSATPQMELTLPERVYSMDLKGDTLAVACGGADKAIAIVHMSQPGQIARLTQSQLKYQTRCIRVFSNQRIFAMSSIEGRTAIRGVMDRDDEVTETVQGPQGPVTRKAHNFAFKCHREDKYIYSVNALDTYPIATKYHDVFVTGGSDGIHTFWDKSKRQRLKEFKHNIRNPIVDVKFDPQGSCSAYAHSYDWSKGAEAYNPREFPPMIFVHNIKEDGELFRRGE